MSDAHLSREQIESAGLAEWTVADAALHARFRTGDFATGLRLVNLVGEAAEAADHHPDLDLRYAHVGVLLTSHDVGGITTRDIRLARRITEIAAEIGVESDPG